MLGSVVATSDYFGVQCVEDDGRVRIVMWGELDRFSAPVLDRHLDAVNATQPSWVVIDATGLSFCGTADVRAIVRAHDTCIRARHEDATGRAPTRRRTRL